MRLSTLALVGGALVFVLPVPGTFVAGAIVFLLGLIARLLGA